MITGWGIGHDLKSGIEELVPVHQAKHALDVNIETKEHWKSTYFEKAGLKQRWTNCDKCFNILSNYGLGAQRKRCFTIHLFSEFS